MAEWGSEGVVAEWGSQVVWPSGGVSWCGRVGE